MNAVTEAQGFIQIELRDDERQRCEVWTGGWVPRLVPTIHTGKKGEHYERKFFTERRAGLR